MIHSADLTPARLPLPLFRNHELRRWL